MKKLLSLMAILAFVVPAMALDITVDDSVSGQVTIGYDATADGVAPCAFALDIVSQGGTLTAATAVDASYNVFIDAASDEVAGNGYTIGEGTAWAAIASAGQVDPLAGDFCYSAAYLEDATNTAPALTGDLMVLEGSGDFQIVANAVRGGVVKADATTPAMATNLPVSFTISAGEPYIGADVDLWISLGRPASWLNNRQCHGDADGLEAGDPKTGYFWVAQGDLNMLIDGWQDQNYVNPTQDPWIAADFDHAEAGDPKTGYFRVGQGDLNILIANWQQSPPADCGQVAP